MWKYNFGLRPRLQFHYNLQALAGIYYIYRGSIIVATDINPFPRNENVVSNAGKSLTGLPCSSPFPDEPGKSVVDCTKNTKNTFLHQWGVLYPMIDRTII